MAMMNRTEYKQIDTWTKNGKRMLDDCTCNLFYLLPLRSKKEPYKSVATFFSATTDAQTKI